MNMDFPISISIYILLYAKLTFIVKAAVGPRGYKTFFVLNSAKQ